MSDGGRSPGPTRSALLAAVTVLGFAPVTRPAAAKKQPCQPATGQPQARFDATPSVGTLRLCAGLFPGNVVLAKAITIAGAGAGSTVRSPTSADGGSAVLVQPAATAVPCGLPVTSDDNVRGGAIGNDGTPTLDRCAVRGNAANDGVGIDNAAAATLTLAGTAVTGNRSAFQYGGIENDGTLDVRSGSVICSANPADGNRAAHASGGGVFNAGTGRASFSKGTKVTGNSSGGNPGGIWNEAGVVTLATTKIVSGNTPDNCGGAVERCVN